MCRRELAVTASRNNETDGNCVKVHRKIEFLLISFITGGMTHLPVVLCCSVIQYLYKLDMEGKTTDEMYRTRHEFMSVPGISPRFLPVFLPFPFTI